MTTRIPEGDDDRLIREMLEQSRRIAVVGASPDPTRASAQIFRYLRAQGYEAIPVNPHIAGQSLAGVTAYASLREVPDKIDLVDIFRRSDQVEPIVEDAIAIGARYVWMQLGVQNAAAAEKARAAGLGVIMNRCIKIEHHRMVL